jgi:segregation and condensation protein A
MDDLKLSLEVFSGPLDLLLYLVVKNEMDILDIDVSKVAGQFCLYVQAMKDIGLDVTGEYLVMASRLVRMKASYVDPKAQYDTGDDDVIDPREELISELLRYRAIKEAALHLERCFKRASRLHPSGAEPPEPETSLSLDEISPWQLAFVYAKLMKEIGLQNKTYTIEINERTVEEFLEEMLKRIEKRVEFISILGKAVKKSEVAGYFLAILEGVRRGLLKAYQTEPFGRIYIERRELVTTEHIPTSEKLDKAVG